ncbi:DNA-directed RNA polymerase subunit alpha [candidate division WWE3 bacterium]|uniref:DNA-directed RNA polymerase subunit alpha n=1 Tax=candidate division WWE3 bacterium TaxID=2053526 RepID=A0A7X9HHT9_UNCKA|nr:DNA-directed RNA polymerase subunit alpha [candidate division WWE3 bacterium]
MNLNLENLKISTVSEDKHVGIFEIEPLPTGFGTTLGNTLRRVLLSSIRGAAVTQAKIAGVSHQFTTIPGVKEDVVEVTMNLKKLRVQLHGDNPVIVTIKKKGPGAVTGADIITSSEVEIMNKDLHIATLADSKSEFSAELTVESGEGYSPMEERQTSKIGVIVLDSVFSPIIGSMYKVEPTRFGKRADYDKLTLTIETDGSVSPTQALKDAADVLRAFYQSIFEGGSQIEAAPEESETDSKKSKHTEVIAIEELPLQTRTINALKKHGIDTLDQLSKKTDDDLADIKNLGEKSLNEIKKLLEKEGYR